MKKKSCFAFLSSVFLRTTLTNQYQSRAFSRRYSIRFGRFTRAFPCSPETQRLSVTRGSAKPFSASTSTQMKHATREPTSMASQLAEDGIDPIAEQYKSQYPWKVYPAFQYQNLVESCGIHNVKLVYIIRHAEGTHNIRGDYKSVENFDARLTPLGESQCKKLCNELLQLKKEVVAAEDIVDREGSFEGGRRYQGDFRSQGLEYLMSNTDLGEEDDGRDVCVVVSPLTRCIQTALLSFDFLTPAPTQRKQGDDNSGNTVPFFGLEALRETVNYQCDRRRRISEISDEFPQIDFSFCRDDEDTIWMSYRQREEEEAKNFSSASDVSETAATGLKSCVESAELNAVADRGRQAIEFLQSLPQSKIVVCTHSAYLRCILNWGQTGGVPRMFEQKLDNREDPTRQDKLFDYCYKMDDGSVEQTSERHRASFEEYMRKDYDNAEVRSFCLLVR